MLPASPCVILVPVGGTVNPGCKDTLCELERRGYAPIDAAPNPMANDALALREA